MGTALSPSPLRGEGRGIATFKVAMGGLAESIEASPRISSTHDPF